MWRCTTVKPHILHILVVMGKLVTNVYAMYLGLKKNCLIINFLIMLYRSASSFKGEKCKSAKLFAKHLKVGFISFLFRCTVLFIKTKTPRGGMNFVRKE